MPDHVANSTWATGLGEVDALEGRRTGRHVIDVINHGHHPPRGEAGSHGIGSRGAKLDGTVNAVATSGMEVGPTSFLLPDLAINENRGIWCLVGR